MGRVPRHPRLPQLSLWTMEAQVPRHPLHPPGAHPPPRHHSHRASASDILSFIRHEDIEQILNPLIPEEGERALVLRALLDVGPVHHRGANYVLLRLLGRVLERLGRIPTPPVMPESVPIPLRLPPPLASGHDDVQFPLRLPTRVLEQIARPGSRELAAMVDCLIDGPPQHSLANAAILCLLEALLREDAARPTESP